MFMLKVLVLAQSAQRHQAQPQSHQPVQHQLLQQSINMAQPQLLNYQQITGSWSVRLFNPLIGILASSGAVAGGSYESIATVSVGSGGQSSIDFTSIGSGWKHLQIRGIARTSTNVSLGIRFNSDSGSNYARHYLNGNGSSVGAGGGGSTTSAYAGTAAQASSTFGANVIDILDYGSTSKYKTVRALSGSDANGSGFLQFMSGLWQNTNAITSISIIQVDGDSFQQYSHFALYGIKD